MNGTKRQKDRVSRMIDNYLGDPWTRFYQFAREHFGSSMIEHRDGKTSVFADGWRWIGKADGIEMGPIDTESQLEWILRYWRLRERRGVTEQKRIHSEIEEVRNFNSVECVERQPWGEIRDRLTWLKSDVIESGKVILELESRIEAGDEPKDIVSEYLTTLPTREMNDAETED